MPSAFSRGSHCNMPCTSTCDGNFTDILISHTTHERKMGMADCIRLYTCPFTTRNQAIKTPEKVDQMIKQASRDGSNDQATIMTIMFLDRRRRWKNRAHSSDYPLFLQVIQVLISGTWRFFKLSWKLSSKLASYTSWTEKASINTNLIRTHKAVHALCTFCKPDSWSWKLSEPFVTTAQP